MSVMCNLWKSKQSMSQYIVVHNNYLCINSPRVHFMLINLTILFVVEFYRSRGAELGLGSMNINGPPIMDMSMNPNGYHQPYLPPTMMPPPPPHSVAGGPPHHNEAPGGGMPVGPPQQQQQPPPAHPPQQQQQQQPQQTQNQTTTANNATAGNNSNQTSESGGQNSTGLTGHTTSSGGEATTTPRDTKKKCWPKKKVYKKPDPNAPKQRRFSGKPLFYARKNINAIYHQKKTDA